LSAQELEMLYAPTEEERDFCRDTCVERHATTDAGDAASSVINLWAYLPAFDTISPLHPSVSVQQLHLPPETEFHMAKNLRSRYRHLIRG